jgi:hypothetical protein
MKVAIVGDLYPGGDLCRFDTANAVLVPEFMNASYRIATLEASISTTDFRADKSVLTCTPVEAQAVKRIGFNAVSLAQNHVHDMGAQGIIDTIAELDSLGIGHAGAGCNLMEARRPVWITEKLCLLAYCRYRELTLNNIALADQKSPGVAPLTLDNILEDLRHVPEGRKVILLFHWGCEHLWLTQYSNISLARRLLREEKVALIVGSHPHRVQGYVEQCGKRAYLSLGNFLFPNFYIDSPCVQVNSNKRISSVPITRYYHTVQQLTYKKWLQANRISLLVLFDVENGQVEHRFVMQKDESPEVIQATWWVSLTYGMRLKMLSFVTARCPRKTYECLFFIHYKLSHWFWRQCILITKVRHLGFRRIGNKVLERINSRMSGRHEPTNK